MGGSTAETGATGSNNKCSFCGGDLTDKKHWGKIPEGGRNTRNGGFRNIVLDGKDVKDHALYNKTAPQAHHLISISAMEDYGEECRAIGYDINCKENCVFLPSNPEAACQYRIQRHVGVHLPAYFAAVTSLVEDVFVDYDEDCDNFESLKKELIAKLNKTSEVILNNIKYFTFLLQVDSLNFHPNSPIGCNSFLKSNKDKAEDNLKESVQDIEAKRLTATGIINDLKYGEDIVTSESKFTNALETIDETLKCRQKRDHRFEPGICVISVGVGTMK